MKVGEKGKLLFYFQRRNSKLYFRSMADVGYQNANKCMNSVIKPCVP